MAKRRFPATVMRVGDTLILSISAQDARRMRIRAGSGYQVEFRRIERSPNRQRRRGARPT